MHSIRNLRKVAVAIALSVSFLSQGTWALAGTTGGVSGTVTDETGKPVAGAKVTATAPSETVSATTDSSGHFAFLSLAPDTYTLQVEKVGFANQSITGVSIFADNNQTVVIRLQPQLQTIAHVTSRAASSLVKAGTTTDVYSVNASVAHAAQALGGGGSLNQAYSALASTPGVYIPQGQSGWAQSVYIRGSNYTELGYEYDGVPVQRAFDAYPSGTLSSLGQQEVQVYAGSAPTDSQSSAIGGFINQVIKTGTYPGFGTANLGYGTPAAYRKLSVEAGGATPDRLFSWYVGVGGYDQDSRFFDQYNGAVLDPQFGTPYNLVAANCGGVSATVGCYSNSAGLFNAAPAGPNGFANGPTFYAIQQTLYDRDVVANFHFALPHHNDGGRDDIQFLYSNTYLKTQFGASLNDWLYATNNVINGSAGYNGATYQNCGPGGFSGTPCATLPTSAYSYNDTMQYTGPVGTTLTSGMLTATSPYLQPNSPTNRTFDSATAPNNADFYQNNFNVVKLQYQKNFGSNAYLRVYGYSSYSDWLQTDLSGATLGSFFTGGVSPDYELITHTRGVSLTFADQLSQKNLLNFTGGYTEASTIRWNNAWYGGPSQVAVAVNSANPTNGICYGIQGGTATPTYCGSGNAAGYSLASATPGGAIAASPLTPTHATDPSVTAINGVNCGGAPCEYFTVQNGMSGSYNTVKPEFSNLSLNDTWRPNDRLTIDAGLHYDNFGYGLDNGTIAPAFESNGTAARTLWQNSVNAFECFNTSSGVSTAASPFGCSAEGLGSQVNWSNTGPSMQAYQEWEPRAGVTYEINPLNVVRVSWGKFAQPADSAYQQYLNANYNLFSGPAVSYYPLGYTSPDHLVYPMLSYNLDASWEHQAKGSDFSFKISPFYRKTNNEIYNVLLDPRTAFVGGVNVGNETVEGAELAITKGDFNRNGFAAQLSYTYTHGTVKFDNLPSGNTVVDGVNQVISEYNAFTSFCAKNSGSASCLTKGQAPTDPNTGKTIVAAPCYTVAGAPDQSCAAGDIANPYWNAPAQQFYNASSSYAVYNTLAGSTAGAQGTDEASSYVIPHVVALLLNYKHDKLRISPSFQFSAGGQYGNPLEGVGVDPLAGCGAALPGSAPGAIAAGADPRYPYGAPGGQPYLAQTCSGSIVTPDQVTGQFDNYGVFTEPDTLVGNLQVDYDVTPRITLSAVAVNLLDTCFGGTKVPWAQSSRLGCWYTSGNYVGNFYNPGNSFQSSVAQPYVPTIGNSFQGAYGGQTNPINLYFSANIKL